MGEVWLAQQQAPIRRRVAVKVIKLGMDTKEVVARFESERQALAMMDHPAIAKVFDAGATPHGRPYFVMEHVPGVSITEHCDRQRLSIRERLALFQQVCAGVQHAHQKAIIHRDLKPSNVLVTMQDGFAVPKIIDFGVAKATGPQLTDKTFFTELGAPIGTPEYMSPEQAEGTGQDIDTRTDVYALGVMLYELLAGARPFEGVLDRRSGFDEIRRLIREEEPRTPSTRMTTSDGVAAAQHRRTDASTLRRQLAGDLDWITMKALEKDRGRRYGSPAELAADIERHLADLPVVAGPPSTPYRTRKFIRRHRFGVGMASAAVLVLLAFAITMTVLAGRIANERDRANREAAAKTQVADFLKELFAVSDPSEARGNSITAREILDRGVEKIDKALVGQLETQAELLAAMGEVYTGLGLYGAAESSLVKAVQIQRAVLGSEASSTLSSLSGLSDVFFKEGRFEEARDLLEEAFQTRLLNLGVNDPDTLSSKVRVADVYHRLGRQDESETLYLGVLSTPTDVLGGHHAVRLAAMNNLADLYIVQERLAEAENLAKDIMEIRLSALGEDHPFTLMALNNLASVYLSQGHLAEARPLLQRGIAIGERVWGPEHPSYGVIIHTLGELEIEGGQLDQADRLLRQALSMGLIRRPHMVIATTRQVSLMVSSNRVCVEAGR